MSSEENPRSEVEPPSEEELQAEIARKAELERKRKENQAIKEAREEEAWKSFIEQERREIELRRNGQLAHLLGDPLPGESPEALKQLLEQDKRQAEEGAVTLMFGGKSHLKHIDELTREDMPARIAANSLRESWLKERRDGWLANGRTIQ